MNDMTKPLVSHKFHIWPFNWGINWYHPNRGWCKHFIYTFESVNLFPMKIYQNYFREEIDANQCHLPTFHFIWVFAYPRFPPSTLPWIIGTLCVHEKSSKASKNQTGSMDFICLFTVRTVLFSDHMTAYHKNILVSKSSWCHRNITERPSIQLRMCLPQQVPMSKWKTTQPAFSIMVQRSCKTSVLVRTHSKVWSQFHRHPVFKIFFLDLVLRKNMFRKPGMFQSSNHKLWKDLLSWVWQTQLVT
jgi:hypothetical protein